MKNILVAEIFENIADLLELRNDNTFKIRAYRRAALNIRNLTQPIETIAKDQRLEEIAGVGKDLAKKIVEIITTGKCKHYEELKKDVPAVLLDLLAIPGIGPKKARLLYEKFKIKSIDQLEELAKRHKISGIPTLKKRSEENILRGIEITKKRSERMTLKEALDLSGEVVASLKELPDAKRITVAGSLRRMKETIRDIDMLVTSARPKKIVDAFVKLQMAKDVLARGDTKAAILTDDDVQVDLRVVDSDSYGAALVYFTGSQTHNIHIRHIAKTMGLKVNEYGVFAEKTNKKIAGKEERDVYKALKLRWMPPELREDRGEIEASAEGDLPELLELSDIRGDLHVHSKWSDGEYSVEDMARACKKKGYEYLAITDHSKRLKIARGLSEKDVLKELDEIKKINRKLKGIRILAGTEVDILDDGSLDFDASILKRFDIVVAAIHSGFKQSKQKLTNRIVKAIDGGAVHILAHPTGRLMGSRAAYEVDFGRVFKAAKETKTCLEISSFAERLDLDDVTSKAAKEAGVKIAIDTDSHVIDQLDSMMLGVSVARRGWLTKKDVLNTMRLPELLKFIRK